MQKMIIKTFLQRKAETIDVLSTFYALIFILIANKTTNIKCLSFPQNQINLFYKKWIGKQAFCNKIVSAFLIKTKSLIFDSSLLKE